MQIATCQVRRKKAVTPVVGTIIVITIILSATAAVLLWGLPYIERTKAEAQKENISSQMRLVKGTLESLINQGPGATEENRITISNGFLQIANDSARIVVYYSFNNDYDFDLDGIDLDDQYKNYFYTYMNAGNVDMVKIYRLGTRTAYTRFNPQTFFENIESQNVEEYILKSSIHNFKDRVNNTAGYCKESASSPPPPSSSYTSYNQLQYDNISNVTTPRSAPRYNVWDTSPGKFVYLHYKFWIPESVSNIRYINMSWRGNILDNNINMPSSSLTFYVWNSSASSWKMIGTLQESPDLTWMNVSLEGEFTNLIYTVNSKNYLSLLVGGGHQLNYCHIYEDYVQIDVSYLVHDTLPPASFINESIKKIKVYYDPENITFDWTGTDLDNVTSPEDLRYMFRLDPSPYSTWQYIGKNTSVTVERRIFPENRFPRGNYTFRVRAIDLANRTEPYDTEFNTYRFEVAVEPQKVIPVNLGGGRYLVNLDGNDISRDFIKMEFFDGDYKFGEAWIFDMMDIVYEISTSSGTFGVVFENDAIIEIQPTGRYVKEPPSLVGGENYLTMDVLQLYCDQGISFGGENQIKLSSRVTDHDIRVTKSVCNLNIRVSGDNEKAWKDYLKAFYNFVEDPRGNMQYMPKSSTISFLLAHTIIEVRSR